MAEKFSNQKWLTYKHIQDPAKELMKYMDDRRHGLQKSLMTRWSKFNNSAMGGIDWNTIITIAGMSGCGKSSIGNELETSLFDKNPDEKFSVLSFNFEMLAPKQVGRKISSKMNMTVQELYSAREALSDEHYAKAQKLARDICAKYDVFYVDTPGMVEEMYNTILRFHKSQLTKKGIGYGTVIFLDHTLLTKGKQGQSEREILVSLYKMCMAVKKQIKCIFVILSQLNRDIESNERVSNPQVHYPMKKDLFGSDAVFHGSDYVLISHKPCMLNLQAYGPKKLPVLNPLNKNIAMIYWHLIKNRDGEGGLIMSMVDNLKYNRVDEYFNPGELQFVNQEKEQLNGQE
tara:strand:- start:82 stop:1116 length:1035 start_codon:yes stop_codon:yes gene_type:complete